RRRRSRRSFPMPSSRNGAAAAIRRLAPLALLLAVTPALAAGPAPVGPPLRLGPPQQLTTAAPPASDGAAAPGTAAPGAATADGKPIEVGRLSPIDPA